MSWLKALFPSIIRRTSDTQKKGVPEGLWTKCKACQAVLYRAELEKNLHVCPKCQYHKRLNAKERLHYFLDPDFPHYPIAEEIYPVDRLKFRDSKKYKDRLASAQKETQERDALNCVQGKLFNQDVVVCSFNFAFMGGSMGTVVGERFVRGVEHSIQHKLPFICFSASGGARMQEGLFSLMQMAKTSAALTKLHQERLPYVSVLTNPTMGGVSASLAMLGDIILAEPKALIGFAGPRVIEQTVRQVLPEGFQSSEFLLEHGHIDRIVSRADLRDEIHKLLTAFRGNVRQ